MVRWLGGHPILTGDIKTTMNTTRIAPCPLCGVAVSRPAVMFGTREILADRPCLCPGCEVARADADVWQQRVRRQLPLKYHGAMWQKVRPSGARAREWTPGGTHPEGIGIVGPSGQGKTHLAALVVQHLRIPFRWSTSAEMRKASITAAAGDGEARAQAERWLANHRDAPLLVIDDLAEAPWSEHWAGWLWTCLENRTARQFPTIWTSQDGEGQLSARIARSGRVEQSTADAIERRLCQDSLMIYL